MNAITMVLENALPEGVHRALQASSDKITHSSGIAAVKPALEAVTHVSSVRTSHSIRLISMIPD